MEIIKLAATMVLYMIIMLIIIYPLYHYEMHKLAFIVIPIMGILMAVVVDRVVYGKKEGRKQ